MFGMSAVDVSLGLNEAVVIEDADAPVSTTIAGIITNSDVEPRITRNMISPNSRMSQRCTEKANNTDESDKDFSASIESRAVRQSTRSRTPRQTYQDEFHTESEQVEKVESEPVQAEGNEENVENTPSIDACASLLAMMDERSYHRNLLCSANRLAREILQPLSLPWMHRCNPVTRNMPFDLDDMAEILMADDGSYTPHENGPLGFGRFDVGQLRRGPLNTRLATSSDSWCSASRRLDDPGILEVSSVFLPLPYSRVSSPTKLQHCDVTLLCEQMNEVDVASRNYIPHGELALRCHEHSSTNKRRRISAIRSCGRHLLVSVKVNASSSRSSLFSGLQMESSSRYGRLLEATLPAEVQSGRILSIAKAHKIAENLGTYDSRHGLSNTSNVGKTANRLSCGRTRLVWTQKIPTDQPQKVSFSSLLTGVRIEGANQKRPRDIKVAIRVDGEIFGSESSSEESSHRKTGMFENFPAASRSIFLSDAVDNPHLQCMMDDEEFVKNILNDAPKLASDRSKVRGRSVSSQPVLDCLPDSNGLIGVVCSSPGRISVSSVHDYLNLAAKESPLRLCTVCWAPDIDQNNLVKECSECGVLVHSSCCHDKGEMLPLTLASDAEEQHIWRCAVCCHNHQIQSTPGSKATSIPVNEQAKKSKRKSRLPHWLQDSHIDDPLAAGRSGSALSDMSSHGIKCELCPYRGGAMSRIRVNNDFVWMHEVCRVWLRGCMKAPTILAEETISRECSLCGQTKRQATAKASSDVSFLGVSEYLVKCAASRCQVYFHPMCALLSSKLNGVSNEGKAATSDIKTNEIDYQAESPQEADRRLCSCFTLTALDCEVTTSYNRVEAGTREVVQVPIAFCGIHNPNREASFRGLYPGGRHVNAEVMRVPALR